MDLPAGTSSAEKKGPPHMPPNRSMDKALKYSTKPKIYDYMLFLDFNVEGNCILGCSSISSSFWEGTLLYFNDVESMLNDYKYTGYYIFASTTDGKLMKVNNTKLVALAEDTGHINIISTEESEMKSVNYFKVGGHVKQISIWDNTPKLVACYANSVGVYDVTNQDRVHLHRYNDVHSARVHSVDTLRNDTFQFVSGARDKMACLWDIRNKLPSVLYRDNCAITAVAWNQQDDNFIVAGSESGSVHLLDKRKPKVPLCIMPCFRASIYRIAFKGSKFAVCGNTNQVLVVDSEAEWLSISYRNDTYHKEPVRDVKWYNNDLYSCGWGKCLKVHSFP